MLPRAIIFDWAGTLVDHGSLAPVKAFQRLFIEYGLPITAAEARGPMGLHKRKHIMRVLETPTVCSRFRNLHNRDPRPQDVESMYTGFTQLQIDAIKEQCHWIHGAPEIIRAYRDRGVLIGSCTGYSRRMMEPLLELAAASGVTFDCVITSCDVSHGRPSPNMIFAACRQMGVNPQRDIVIKVGDTLADIQEGFNAKVVSVGVTDTGNEMGLSYEQLIASALDADKLSKRRIKITEAMLAARATTTIASVADLPSITQNTSLGRAIKNGLHLFPVAAPV